MGREEGYRRGSQTSTGHVPSAEGKGKGNQHLHLLTESLHIHSHILCSCKLLSDLQREAIGVVQHKGILATHAWLGFIGLLACRLCTTSWSIGSTRADETTA